MAVELADGLIATRAGVPTAWWTLHTKDLLIQVASDETFRLVGAQHIDTVQLLHNSVNEEWLLEDPGILWMIYVIAGVLTAHVRDEQSEDIKTLLPGMGLMAGGKVSCWTKGASDGIVLFLRARA